MGYTDEVKTCENLVEDLEDYFEEELFKEKDIIEKVDYLFEEIKKLKIQLKKVSK